MSRENLTRLFVANKPTGLSSNQFLGRIKRRYNVKKAGYSGTLDPFAKGALIVAFGNHTRLFRFLNKAPKTYKATLWLGAASDTLDIEAIEKIENLEPVEVSKIESVLESFKGELTYLPPIFCAKKVNGIRAYDLARKGEEVELNAITSTIYDIKLHHYMHPFVTFEATVSEGTYIRSLGDLISKKLGIEKSSLSALERVSEGLFRYNNEKALDIKTSLNIEQNYYTGDVSNVQLGKKLSIEEFTCKDDGIYWIDNDINISIIKIENQIIKYELNKVELC